MNDTFMEKALTPAGIIQLGIKFEVPIYQRLFVWEQQQIDKLLGDLKEASKAPDKPYYIGIITINENKDHIWEVVDGQQRLTFLTLFGAMCIHKKLATSSTKWREFLFSDNDALRINYFGRQDDSNDIKSLSSSGQKSVQNSNFNCFAECFESLKMEDAEWDKYAQYVFEHTSFFVSHLPNQYEPRQLNIFFEKMNSAGRQLTPVDLVKIKFANFANEWNACMNFNTAYTAPQTNESQKSEEISINTILENASNIKVVQEPARETSRIGNQLIIKPEVFLLHVLRLSTKNDSISLDGDKLLETFNNNPVDEKTFIDTMKEYRTWLDKNIIYLLAEENSSYTYAFREDQVNSESEDSSLENVFEKVSLLDKRKMRQFQSMLYVSSSDSQEWIFDAYTESKDLTFDLLRRQDWKRHPLPEYSEMKYPDIGYYWFWKLDYLLWELNESSDNKDKIISEYVFRRSNHSREHLQPQADPFPNKEDEDSFGNLALIAPGTNSSLSDNLINTKFGRVQDILNNGNGHLESIKLLRMFRLAKTDDGLVWNEDKVKKHGKEMHDILKKDMEHYLQQ